MNKHIILILSIIIACIISYIDTKSIKNNIEQTKNDNGDQVIRVPKARHRDDMQKVVAGIIAENESIRKNHINKDDPKVNLRKWAKWRPKLSSVRIGPNTVHHIDEMDDVPVLGKQFILELQQCDFETIGNAEVVDNIIVQAVEYGNATLVKHWAHQFNPYGVTALALLSESHVAVHTWPEHRYAAVDVFTCGDTAYPDKISQYIESAFGCHHKATAWSHSPRGGITYVTDVNQLHHLRLRKYFVASMKSQYQTIDIYDIPQLETLLSGAIQAVGRVMYLDGALQSAESDEYIYHEALIHPPMLAHPDPKFVVIIGGGEGAALREVLRHSSVKKAVLAELDPIVTGMAQAYLPSFHAGAFEDPRTELKFGDGIQYLRDLPDGSVDVLVLDILDPEPGVNDTHVSFSNPLFQSNFYELIYKKLDPNGGVMVTNTGGMEVEGRLASAQVITEVARAIPSVAHYTVYVPSFQNLWTFTIGVRCPESDEYKKNKTMSEVIGKPLCSGHNNIFKQTHQIVPVVDEAIKTRITDEGMGAYDGMAHLRMFMLPKEMRDVLAKLKISLINAPIDSHPGWKVKTRTFSAFRQKKPRGVHNERADKEEKTTEKNKEEKARNVKEKRSRTELKTEL